MTVPKNTWVLVLACTIFLGGLCQGFVLAVNKPLWTDEIYSQMAHVERKDFRLIWSGSIGEGNNTPLFYSIQKLLCLALRYQAGDLEQRQDAAARFILRISPVIFMSFGLAFVFWYFARAYYLFAGVLAFLMALSTYLVWAYWAEARPYAMVFCGTAIQSAVLLNVFRFRDFEKAWRSIFYAHIFLVLTWPLSAIQILASAVMLWLSGCRKPHYLFFMIAVPLAVVFGYHFVHPDMYINYWFAPYGQPLELMKAAVPEGRFLFLLAVSLLLWGISRKSGQKVSAEVWLFLGWVWLTILGYGGFLLYYWLKQRPFDGFELSNRYMIPLVPVGVAGMTVLCVELMRRANNFWSKLLVLGLVLALVLPRLVKVFHWSTTGVF